MPSSQEITLDAKLEVLSAVRGFLREHLAETELSKEESEDLVLAVDEAVTNIIRHGYRGTAGVIRINFTSDNGQIEISLSDTAPLYDPTRQPEPDFDVPFYERGPGGLGVFLMRKNTDALTYQVNSSGENELTMIKRISKK